MPILPPFRLWGVAWPVPFPTHLTASEVWRVAWLRGCRVNRYDALAVKSARSQTPSCENRSGNCSSSTAGVAGKMLKNEVVIMQIEAIYEHGVLRPIKPLSLAEGERVELRLITALAANAKRQAKREREARELEIINRNADRLNAEAMDVLDYQIEL